jgi:hypothetical protein
MEELIKMVNIQFSSNNANNQIRIDNFIEKHKILISNNFKCNNADNKVKKKKSVVVLGDRTKLWD